MHFTRFCINGTIKCLARLEIADRNAHPLVALPPSIATQVTPEEKTLISKEQDALTTFQFLAMGGNIRFYFDAFGRDRRLVFLGLRA
jgi:hypothetical protein